MSYEFAPSTIMLATRCAVCRRALRDAKSVEVGMGPDCRQKHGYTEIEDASEEARTAANAIIHRAACYVRDEQVVAECCSALRLLGFVKVADRIEYRGKDAPAADTVTITEGTSDPLPAIYRYGRYLPARPGKPGVFVTCPYKPAAVADMRGIPGRYFVKATKQTFFPADQKPALWALLRRHYAGLTLVNPEGLRSTIPASR